jgi:hypothetical protein
MINMEIIRLEIYMRVDMRGANHEIKIANLLRHERTKDNSIIHWTKWIHHLEIEIDKTVSWSSKKGYENDRK